MRCKNLSNQKEIFYLIKALAGQANILTIPRAFIKFTGSVEAALLLSQIIYWSDRNPRGKWFYKSYREWEQEIGLSKHKVSHAAAILTSKKLIKTKVKKANGNPTLHYLFDQDAFIQWFSVFLTNESQNPDYPVTETKTEINNNHLKEPLLRMVINQKESFRAQQGLPGNNDTIQSEIHNAH
uniref:Uncharacterized protein n=1 Tax=viral metagenome TaxID=1070528 RepID=A0A6M3Y5S8_9ZZZZ